MADGLNGDNGLQQELRSRGWNGRADYPVVARGSRNSSAVAGMTGYPGRARTVGHPSRAGCAELQCSEKPEQWQKNGRGGAVAASLLSRAHRHKESVQARYL